MKIALCDDDEKELSNIRSLLDSYQKTHNIPFTYQEYHIKNITAAVNLPCGHQRNDSTFIC